MNLYRDINLLPQFYNTVLTIGSFDGVHKGHVQVIKQIIKAAKNIDGTAVLITFYPHPQQVVQNNNKPLLLLNTPGEKYELLKQAGILNIIEVPFNTAFAALSADDYIAEFLVQKFNPKIIVVGYDHKFGNKRTGNFSLLKSNEHKYGYLVNEIPAHLLQQVTISSTKIREALLLGHIEIAETLLGYPYFFSGQVIMGNQLGRTIGYPTANLYIEDEHKLIPANAVYAVQIQWQNKLYRGMMNIGVRPTVGGTTRSIEVNIFDFTTDIYGETLKITFIKKIRNEVKFNSLSELKTQLNIDKIAALQA